jgi:hypothetical protein
MDVLCKEARYRILKLRDAAMILGPRLRAEELSLQISGGRMSDSLVNLLLGQLLRYEPAFAEREFVSIEDLSNVFILPWWHKVGFGKHTDTSRCGLAVLDEPESRRCFDILVGSCTVVSCVWF